MTGRLRDTTGGLPRVYWHLWTATLVTRVGNFVIVYLTLHLSTVLGLPPATIGLLLGAMGAGSIAGSQLAGLLADRWSRRRTLILAQFAGTAAMTALAFAEDVATLAVLLVFYGATLSMPQPAFATMVIDVVAPADRTRAFTLTYWANNLGFAGAALLAGLAAGYAPWAVFAVNATTAALTGVHVWARIPETRPQAPPSPRGGRTGLLRTVGGDRIFLVFLALAFVPGFLQVQLVALLPLQVTAAGLTPGQYGWIVAVNGLLIVAGQLFVPRLVTGRRDGAVLAVSAGFWAVGTAATGLAGSVPLFALTVVLWTVGEMLQVPGTAATLAALSPVDMRARYQAVFALAGLVPTILAPTLGGLGLQRLGAGWWLIGGGLGVVAVVGHLLAAPARERRLASPPQVSLDGRQLLGTSLDLRSLEPLAGRDQPPHAGETQDREHGDRRVVEAGPGHRALLRKHEQHRDEPDPHHRDHTDRRAPAAQMPRAAYETLALPQTQDGRQHVGDVETDDRH